MAYSVFLLLVRILNIFSPHPYGQLIAFSRTQTKSETQIQNYGCAQAQRDYCAWFRHTSMSRICFTMIPNRHNEYDKR